MVSRVVLELSSCAQSLSCETPHHIHRDKSAVSRTLPTMGKRQVSNINLWWQLNPSSWNCEWQLEEIIVMGRQQTISKCCQGRIFACSWMSVESFLAGICGKEKSFHLVLENHRGWEHLRVGAAGQVHALQRVHWMDTDGYWVFEKRIRFYHFFYLQALSGKITLE